MLRAFCYGALIILMAACGDDSSERTDGYSETPKNQEDSLFQDVMDSHDTAMAKMGKLTGFRKKAEQKLDSLKNVSSQAKESMNAALKNLVNDLKKAEDDMNTWMEDFSIDSAQDDLSRRISYLTSEKIKVDKVKEDIMSVLDKADSLLKK